MEYTELMNEFAGRVGLTDPSPIEDGTCRFDIDGMVVNFVEVSETRQLATWAAHTSEREELAAEAERGLLEIKKYRLLESEISTRQIVDYSAVVVKCMPFGCFVEIPELAVSGLVHISQLSHRFVRFNESDQSLSAPGESWHVGDRLRVQVARVDFQNRRIDFVPVRERTFGNKRKGRR